MSPMNLEFVKDLWLPNIFIYNLKTYKVIDVLSKLAGLWIDTNKKILYSQATHIRWGTGDGYFFWYQQKKSSSLHLGPIKTRLQCNGNTI